MAKFKPARPKAAKKPKARSPRPKAGGKGNAWRRYVGGGSSAPLPD